MSEKLTQQVTVRLSAEVQEELARIARRERREKSELIRIAVEDMIRADKARQEEAAEPETEVAAV